MAAPATQFTQLLCNTSVTPMVPLLSTNVTVTNMDNSNPATATPAAMFTDVTGGTAAGSNVATTDSSGNLTVFLAPAGSDGTSRYKFTPSGLPTQIIQVPIAATGGTFSGAVTHTGNLYIKAVNRPQTLDALGGDPTGATDCGAAINTALSGFKGVMELHPKGLYKTSTTINIPPANFTMRGCWGGIIPSSGILANGSQFLWSGASGGTVLKLLDGENVVLDGVCIDGGGVANVTGLLIDSDNNPASYMVDVGHFYIQRCGTGTGTGYGIRLCQSIANSYQADKIQIHDGTIYAGDTGLSIESDNACDGTVIKGLSSSSLNVHLQILACGEMSVDGWIFGGFLGSDPAYISLGQRGNATQRYNPLTFRSCQGEMSTATIAAGSNGAALPQATINVSTTVGWPASGTTLVQSSAGLQLVTYTGTTATSFTGCSGGTGTMSTGGEVWPGYMLRAFGTPDTGQPLNLISNTFGGPCDVTVQKRVVSEGNYFGANFYLSGTTAIAYPRADTFVTGRSFQPVGAGSKVGTPIWVNGENGQGGACVLSAVTSGAPTIAGNIGDLCVRRDTGAVYRCTVAGVAGGATWTTP